MVAIAGRDGRGSRTSVIRETVRVTTLMLDRYVDPLVWYRVVRTDVVLLVNRYPDGGLGFHVGVNPVAAIASIFARYGCD